MRKIFIPLLIFISSYSYAYWIIFFIFFRIIHQLISKLCWVKQLNYQEKCESAFLIHYFSFWVKYAFMVLVSFIKHDCPFGFSHLHNFRAYLFYFETCGLEIALWWECKSRYWKDHIVIYKGTCTPHALKKRKICFSSNVWIIFSNNSNLKLLAFYGVFVLFTFFFFSFFTAFNSF